MTNSLYSDGTASGGAATVTTGTTPTAPTIDAAGVSLGDTTLSPTHTAATVSDANQEIVVSGPSGATVRLLHVEAERYLSSTPDGGYDIEEYEANRAMSVTEYTATVGSGGTASIPVTLTNSSEGGGLNHFVAVVENDTAGRTSNVIILEYTG